MKMFHDEQGHQAAEKTMALTRERFHWSTLYNDVTCWVRNYKRCKKTKGPYADSKPKQGPIC